MTELDKDIVALLSRRAYDLAGSSPGVKVYLNGNRLPVSCCEFHLNQVECRRSLFRVGEELQGLRLALLEEHAR